ncbi:MAG: acyl-CoA/acyl-ACP dehydrogenase [Alphaproteobacteria bacterium]|jgi:acyl-CoA dehydrogenase|nr:acyl-CoA/acyl-ACP dehydrogenase [Alphaproteobacteria bacterium]MBN9578789.1 acyl-CoA/acyl-ACP dehydrogenase [Alphaproteobacteria bacterium]MBN9592374.1 acyl-CoA/acyl-ACP dehydrogenase [Alphaproteobacteria bacterium]
MNFDFSDDQKMLRDQARRFLTEKCTAKTVRKVFESDAGHDATLWKQIAEMGWHGTAIPENYGGLGLGYLELCVVAEELGRALAPVPFSSTVYLFAEALLAAGSEEQKKKYLPKVASGELIGTFARAEGPGAVTPKSIRLSFKGGKLSGKKIAVADGLDADYAVVLARTGDEAGERGLGLALVDLKGPGVTRRVEDSIDPSRKHAELSFDNAPAEALGKAGEGWDLANAVLNRAAILMAFEQVGGADICLAMAKDYAMTRYAFGRPIGSFQAIKHKLAEMYVNNELARSNAYYGAWALLTNARELPVAAAAARVSATQAFDYAAKENIQTHGGIGFTWEVDCHLFYKRSRELGLVLGSQRSWKDKLVNALELSNAA